MSCNLEEEYASKKGYQEKMKISHVKFNELLKDNKFSKAYGKVQDKRSLVGKTVMEEQYNFTIADKPVKVLEWAEGITYTILINRTIKDITFFENLVVEQFTDGQIRANIIKYTPFQPSNVQSYFSEGNFSGNRTLLPIIYNTNESSITGKYSVHCSRVCTTLCYDCQPNYSTEYQTPHTPGSNCSQVHTSCEDICVTIDGGGDGASDGAGSGPPLDMPDGGGGGAPIANNTPVENPVNNCGNCNVPIYTAPVLEEEEIAPPKTPCEELQKLLNNTESVDALTFLEGKTSEAKEYGFAYQALPNSSDLDELHPIESLPNDPLKLHMEHYVGGNFIGAYHTHPDPAISLGIPMFAADDIKFLYKLARLHSPGTLNSDKDYSVYFLTLTIESATYAIKINDVVKFYDFMGNKYASFKTRLEDKYAKMPDNLYLFPSQSFIEKEFLKILNNKEQSGIGLYILNDDKTNWDELMINPLFPNSNVKRKPCNIK